MNSSAHHSVGGRPDLNDSQASIDYGKMSRTGEKVTWMFVGNVKVGENIFNI